MTKRRFYLVVAALFAAAVPTVAVPVMAVPIVGSGAASAKKSHLTKMDHLYVVRFNNNIDRLSPALHQFSVLIKNPEFASSQWQQDQALQAKLSAALLVIHRCASAGGSLYPTPRFQISNQHYVAALAEYDYLYVNLQSALRSSDDTQLSQCTDHLTSGNLQMHQETAAFISALTR